MTEARKNIFIVILSVPLLILCISTTAKTQEYSLWEDLGLYGGQILSVAVDPEDSSTLYAGSWNGDGLFKSTDGGETWSSISYFRNFEVIDIAIDPNNPSNIWVAFNHFLGFSNNYGETWEFFFFAVSEQRLCVSVEVDPHDSSGKTVYAGTFGPRNSDSFGAIFKTTNSGKTWFKTKSITRYDVLDIHINPVQPGEVWAISSPYSLSQNTGLIYVTQNNGFSWDYWSYALTPDGNKLPLGYMNTVLSHPTDPLTTYACGTYGVFRKTSGSDIYTDWQLSKFISKGGAYAMCIPPSEPDSIYAQFIDQQLGTATIAKSSDIGKSWNESFEAPAIFLRMHADPYNQDIIYAGSHSRGVFKTVDGAQSWIAINNGIRANSILSTDLFHNNSVTILCGTVAGVYTYTVSQKWNLIHDSPSYAVSFHPGKENIIYAGFENRLGKTTDGGKSWSSKNISTQSGIYRIETLALSPGNPDIVFAGLLFSSREKGEIVKITDTGMAISEASFESLLLTSVPVNTIAVHPSDPNIIFAGTGSFYAPGTSGGLFVSTDAGKSWTEKLLSPSVIVNSIAFSSSNPDIVYAACGRSGTPFNGGIFKSTDRGNTWENKTDGLPKIFSVADIKVDSSNSNIVYAALYKAFTNNLTSIGGIYLSLDGGNYWTQIGLSDYLMYDVNFFLPDTDNQTSTALPLRKTPISFPSGTIFAGTASGLYQSTTSGTGIITGNIISQKNSTMIDGAIVSSPFGSNSISVEGYYMLMVPAGLHTIQVQAAGFIQTSHPSITVATGQSTSIDILMQPFQYDNNTICLAEQLLTGTPLQDNLPLFKTFRDKAVMQTATGRVLIDLYYKLGYSIWLVLQKNPKLKKRCFDLVGKSIPMIKTYLSNNSQSINPFLPMKAMSFLSDLSQVSPPELKKHLNRILSDMDFFKITP
jgi:photosystem II stability/assembly factor-like uncharacterized protein